MRLVEDDIGQLWVRLQHADQERPVPAGDVHHLSEGEEVDRSRHRRSSPGRERGHVLVE
jgi:hypothetical protein